VMRGVLAILAALLVAASGAVAADKARPGTLSLTSTFPSSVPIVGEGALRLVEKVARATGGGFRLRFHEQGTLVPVQETLLAVSQGRIDAAWAGTGWFADVDATFHMFSAIPFGPDIGEYLAWMYQGGGLETARTLFAEHNVYNIPCALLPPEASGWFRKEIRTVADLRGLRIRFFGLGAKVMQKLGATTFPLAPNDIYPALEAGMIDAAEFAVPSMDQQYGFHKVAPYYYFPGWHQQATFFNIYVNLKRWAALPDRHKAAIEIACGDIIRESIAEGEAAQWKAMKQMQADGVQIRHWPPEIIAAMESAWNEVAAEAAAASPNFKRVYESYVAFRRNYAIWRESAYLR
jgi:TRAP-type mannitol/chloroaromatic compound transport system substrate-binding protein